jgi:hypothetical protein
MKGGMLVFRSRNETIYAALGMIEHIAFRPDGSTLIHMPVCVFEVLSHETTQESIREQIMSETYPATLQRRWEQ